MAKNQQKMIDNFFPITVDKIVGDFPLLTIILKTTSRFKLLYTAQNLVTLASALLNCLKPLALWF